MNPVRLAIVGGGHLGRIHTRLASQQDDVSLVAVVEPDARAGHRLRDEFACQVVSELGQLADPVDAAIVASPTETHFEIANRLLARGCHLLVEKPLTTTAAQADQLIAAASRHQRVLQVGHVERFNPAFEQARQILPTARYIEARRMSGYTFRSVDVGVVHDLMIHDIDLTCALVPSPLVETRAVGIAVFGPHEDIAQARLEFADGTVASLTASRCSFQPARQISWFGEKGFVAADLASGTLQSVGCSSMIDGSQPRDVSQLPPDAQHQVREALFENVLPRQQHAVEPQNAILQEQRDFLQAIRLGRQPRVSGRDGRRAVAVAQSIVDAIGQHRWQDGNTTRIGHQASRVQLLPVESGRRAG